MLWWVKHIRKIVYCFSATLAVVWYWWAVVATANSSSLGRLIQYYALTAVSFLYLALLASPLYGALPKLPGRPIYITARRALGLSAFSFGLLHGLMAFVIDIGGFPGLYDLPASYLVALAYSSTALVILTIMAATSNDYATKKLGRNWKRLHRLVYLAGVLLLFHSTQLGGHIGNRQSNFHWALIAAVIVLMLLETLRWYRYLHRTKPGLAVIGTIIFCSGWLAVVRLVW